MTSSLSEADLYYKLDNMVLGSIQQPRKVFKSRWKQNSGKDWLDDAPSKVQLLNMLTPPGSKTKKCPLQNFQQVTLKDKALGDWDMSLLSAIFLTWNHGDPKPSSKEIEAVRNLKNIRNELAHDETGTKRETDIEEHSTRKCTLAEYEKHVKTLQDSLIILGMDDKEIKKLIERSGVTSSLKALERVKHLYQRAKFYVAADQFDEAISIFTDAISTPSLLSEHRGEAYENRAKCYLMSTKNSLHDVNHIEQALLDITQALEYNRFSYNAHYLAAQCHREKFNFSKAIYHYEMALAISPVQKHVKQDLYTCRTLAGLQNREDHMNPSQMPMNFEERIAHWNKEKGGNISAEQLIFLHRERLGLIYKGQDYVFLGHQYFDGWNVEQSYNTAVRFYAKADKVGNPEGSYNLALCYEYGKGVTQDAEKAFEIYGRVALMDEKTLGIPTRTKHNAGVAAARQALGLCYQFGIGVEKDFEKAAKWYQKAMENGVKQAANNLGILYSEGCGVPLDKIMAEMCWRQGVIYGDVNAAESLAVYYIHELEPEKAKHMFRIGKEMGNHRMIAVPDEELNRTLEEIKCERKRVAPMVKKFEISHKLKLKNVTFKERVRRALEKTDPYMAKVDEIKEYSSLKYNMPSTKMPMMVKSFGKMLAEFEKMAQNDSNPAVQKLWNKLKSVGFGESMKNPDEHSNDSKTTLLETLYKIALLRIDFVPLKIDERVIVADFFEKSYEQVGIEDMKARLCHLMTNLWTSLHSISDTFALEVLKEGVRRYPDNMSYHNLIIHALFFRKQFQEGLKCSDNALKIFPGNADLMFSRAFHVLGCKDIERSDMRDAFLSFIKIAPRDHENLPEAYYLISMTCLPKSTTSVNKDTVDMVESYFNLGQNAEKDQLSCKLFGYHSEIKPLIVAFLEKMGRSPKTLPSLENKVFTDLLNKPAGILERKEYLKSPVRKAIILQHRDDFKCSQFENVPDYLRIHKTSPPKLQQKSCKNVSMLEPISLIEMNPTDDKIFENRILELTIVDDPNPNFASIHLVAEDVNGDCTFLYIYNVDREAKAMSNFQVGCKIAVINPYMRIGAQCPTNGIRVDEPKCIVYLDKMENLCRFCGEENAARKCSKCKRLYCSRECQTLDWKEMGHKMICSIRFN